MSLKEKEGRTKEENHKLLNGNSIDTADWVYFLINNHLNKHCFQTFLSSSKAQNINFIHHIFYQRPRAQVNGKILEDSNGHIDTTMNGA